MLDTLTVDRERMRAAAAEGFTTATSVADTLVRQGVPFRAAHHIVGTLVAGAEAAGIGLEALDDDMIATALAASEDPERPGARPQTRRSGRPSGPQPTSTLPLRAAT